MTQYNDSPWIDNKKIFKAVSFCRHLMSNGIPIELAIYKSAKYYKIAMKELAKEMGRLGAFVREKKKKL